MILSTTRCWLLAYLAVSDAFRTKQHSNLVGTVDDYEELSKNCDPVTAVSGKLVAATQKKCALLCENNDKCYAFVTNATSNAWGYCYLKGSCGGSSGKCSTKMCAYRLRGLKQKTNYEQLSTSCLFPVTHVSSKIIVTMPQECADTCDKEPKCNAFVTNGEGCYLKGACGGRPGPCSGSCGFRKRVDVDLNPTETLRQAAASVRDDFYMGAGALKVELLNNKFNTFDAKYTNLAKQQFNAGTAGNDCKYGMIQKREGKFSYKNCDSDRDFVVKEMKGTFRCHALAWGNQNKAWLYSLTNASKKANLIASIAEIVGYYGTDCWAWDVVNEAVEDGTKNAPQEPLTAAWKTKHLKTNGKAGGADLVGFAQHPWYPYVPDYVDIAFREARKACQKCKLFYNDYNAEGAGGPDSIKVKSDKVYEFALGLINREVPIDGVGLQMHLKLAKGFRPSIAGIRANIERLTALGLEVHITEADIKVPSPWTEAKELEQAKLYAEVLHACWSVKGCTAFYTWGFTDAYSWLYDRGDFVAPLPFDADYNPKLAVKYMIHILKGKGVTWPSVDS